MVTEHWLLIEADLHEFYGIDLGDRALLRSRSWRWLWVRIVGLLSVESGRLRRTLYPPKTPETPGATARKDQQG